MARFWQDLGFLNNLDITDKFLVGKNSDGSSVYTDLQTVYNKISQVYFADAKPSVIAAGSVLTNPNSLTCYIAPAGTYTLPSGNVTLTGNINFFFWDFSAGWTWQSFSVQVGTSNMADASVTAAKLDVTSVYALLSQMYFVDTKPSVIAAGSVLTTPTSLTCYIAPAGSYTLPTGNVNLQGNINFIFWDAPSGWNFQQFEVLSKKEVWSKKAYFAGQEVLHAGISYYASAATTANDEPSISPIWYKMYVANAVDIKAAPYKTTVNSQFINGDTTYISGDPIIGMRITVQGSSVQDSDILKIALDTKGSYIVMRVYEGTRVVDAQKVVLTKTGKYMYYLPFSHSIKFKSNIPYTIELESDDYLGFTSSTLRGSTIPYLNGFYKTAVSTPNWTAVFNNNTKGIGFELLGSYPNINTSNFLSTNIVAGTCANGIFNGSSLFSGWGFSVDVLEYAEFNSLIVKMDNVNYNDSILVRIMKRLSQSDSGYINESDGDIFLLEKSFSKSLFQDISTEQFCKFDFGQNIGIKAGERIVFEILPTKSSVYGRVGIGYYQSTSNRTSMFCYKMGDTLRYVNVSSGTYFPAYCLLGNSSNSKKYQYNGNVLGCFDSGSYVEYNFGSTTSESKTATQTVNLQNDSSIVYWTQLKDSDSNAIINVSTISVAGKSEGIDYEVNRGAGMIRALVNTFTSSISTTFVYEQRVALAKNIVTGAFEIIKAIAGRTAGLEYQIPINSKIILYEFILRGSQLIEVDPYSKRSYSFPTLLQQRAIARNMKFRRKLQLGNLVIGSYSDSITAQQDAIVNFSPDYLPNGDNRDKVGYNNGILSSDYINTIPIIDGHTQTGFIWYLINALKASSTANISYLNYSIAGTNSANSINNGLWPARLNSIVNSTSDLVIIGFAMNEIGSNDTFNNLIGIASALQAAGKECVFLECPKPSNYNTWWSTDNWEKTNNMIRKAAEYSKSPFVPFSDFLKNGWNRFDDYGRCRQNNWNHLSPEELKIYGEMIIAVVL